MHRLWIIRARSVFAAGLLAALASACSGYVSGPARGFGPVGTAGTPRLSVAARHGLPPVSTTVMPSQARFDTGGGPTAYACQQRVAMEPLVNVALDEPIDAVLGRLLLDYTLQGWGPLSGGCGERTRPSSMHPTGTRVLW